MMRVFFFALLMFGVSPCRPADGYYDFRLGYGEAPYGGAGFSPNWGGQTPAMERDGTLRRLWVGFPAGRLPATPAIVILRDGEPVDLSFRAATGLPVPGHADRDAQLYELHTLSPGDYTIVHRRGAVPADLDHVSSGPPIRWVQVDGTDQVETILTVTAGGGPLDAGVPLEDAAD